MKVLSFVVMVLAMALTGCASRTVTPLARTLPDWPSVCQPVEVKDPKTGERLLVVAARERAGRVQANEVIRSCADWYVKVKASYEAGS